MSAAALNEDTLQDGGGGDDESPSIIRPIEAETVRRIVAGQAVTDLASAVKELVDNALDAGSKSINIRLFNQGLDIVEVSDDGSGVPPASRPFMAQPHATSKIRSFEDIYDASSTATALSLGFRGEALFCLANLSEKLVVMTRTAEEPVGQQMSFGHDGSLLEETIQSVPRKVGTTVAVVKLLGSLPVRRSDMERRISQHRAKLMKLMEGYAIFSVGVRINLMDVVGRKENTLLATTAHSNSLQQTVSSVLGSKFLANLTPLSIDLRQVLQSSREGEWKLEGLVSKSPNDNSSSGNSKAGQHYFSINGRPVELPKITRILGEVWRAMGGKKQPSCVLTLTLPNNEYDVNLSPEKRQVLLTHEAELCQVIQAGVTDLWNSQTQGQFAPGAAASQVATTVSYSQSTLLPTPEPASRKRSREGNAVKQTQGDNETGGGDGLDCGYGEPSSSKENNNNDDVEMDCGYEEHAPKRTYYQKQREQQEEQMTLNASGNIDCQYDEEHPNQQELLQQEQLQHDQQQQQSSVNDEMASPERRRVRRRGGFVHDISTAKQFERPPPTPVDEHFTMPPIEGHGEEREHDEDDMDTEDEAEVPSTKKRSAKLGDNGTSPVPTETSTATTTATTEAAQIMMSTRRVTLALNNTLETAEQQRQEVQVQTEERTSKSQTKGMQQLNTTAVSPADEDAAATHNTVRPNNALHFQSSKESDSMLSDDDRRLWIEARARFNQRKESDNEMEMLDESTERPEKTSEADNRRVTPAAVPRQTERDRERGIRERGIKKKGGAFSLSQFACPTVSRSKDGRAQQTTSARLQTKMQEQQLTQEPLSINQNEAASTPGEKSNGGSPSTDVEESSDENASIDEPEEVIWGSFQGTEEVVSLTKLERQQMRQRKRKLKKARSATSTNEVDDGDSTGVDPNKKISLVKGDFAGMTVLGQFNLGFILAIDPHNHLWILDQHACDERYNFEKLKKETVIREQKLIAPMPLELDPSEESCVLDHLAIFEKNGFRFKYDPEQPPRHRLALTSLPHSGARDGRKAVQFGAEDVSALCAILGGSSTSHDDDDGGYANDGGTGTDGSGLYGNNAVRRYASSFPSQLSGKSEDSVDKLITRLPKAVAMFASRACRSSIMIGTALSKKEMEKVVKRLDGLEDPWNCAHGRPTMTHVTDLRPGLLQDERRAAEHIAGPTVTMSMTQPEEAAA